MISAMRHCGFCAIRFALVYVALVMLALSPARVTAASERSQWLAPVSGANSQLTLRKCIARGGAVANQSAPCTAGSSEIWSRTEVLATPAVSAPTQFDAPQAPRARAMTAARNQGRSTRRQQCDAARREATRRRDAEWNRLKFDDLSRLDAWVAERCR